MRLITVALGLLVSQAGFASHPCPSEWKHDQGLPGCGYTQVAFPKKPLFNWPPALIRHGYLEASPNVPFRGNVLYLEGIADSMLNHVELFKAVTDEGYRVVAFDLENQGGSPGIWGLRSMADTLLIADKIYQLDALAPRITRQVLMGWSIGGITGYYAAAGYTRLKPYAVILLAPSIYPRPWGVGEGIFHWPPGVFTEHALVKQPFTKDCPSPFVDEIKPFTPAQAPLFATSILAMAYKTRHSNIPKSVKGLVLMSGLDDTFVYTFSTEAIFRKRAPHFDFHRYPGTRHMIDAEGCDVRSDINYRVADFLRRI